MNALHRYTKQIYPIGLLIEQRPCLIVGGGTVGARKALHLLEAGASVTILCPDVCAEMGELCQAGRVQHRSKKFEDTDLDGFHLVFAATDDKHVNRRVLEACHVRRILCCCVDGNWTESEFVTPAVIRKGELTVAVSTGGRSCRRSRLIKESLSRHIETVENADLLVLGTSHNYLSLQEREPYHLAGKRLENIGRMIMQIWGVHEFVILNTCNRIELLAVVSNNPAVESALKCILSFDHLKKDGFYLKRGLDAFEHLSATCAGLLSQMPGEYHIVAQVKEALEISAKAGWAEGMMQEWLSAALHISKDIRQVTGPHVRNLEIEDLCIQYLQAECENFAKKRLLVVGSGMVGMGVVDRFLKLNPEHTCDWCYHLNKPDLPSDWQQRVALCNFNNLRDRLASVDVVVCATSSSGHILHQGHAPFFDQEKDIILVDLAMPRNISPELDHLVSNIHVADLDGLKHWFRREAIDMARLFELSRKTVKDHQDMYEKIIRSFQGGNRED
ncbi:MAG: NAD(P)-dependent oxidoreductase [Verrucomicrobiae bacterium]|nr:NAD(P)-dependent oxidoreductase [Verrucomicrobiae bacterium]